MLVDAGAVLERPVDDARLVDAAVLDWLAVDTRLLDAGAVLE